MSSRDNRRSVSNLIDRTVRRVASTPHLWIGGIVLATLDLLPVLAAPVTAQIGFLLRYGVDARRFDRTDPSLALGLTGVVTGGTVLAIVLSAIWLAGWWLLIDALDEHDRSIPSVLARARCRWRPVVETWARLMALPFAVAVAWLLTGLLLILAPGWAERLGGFSLLLAAAGVVVMAIGIAVMAFGYPFVWWWTLIALVPASRGDRRAWRTGWATLSREPGRLLLTALAIWAVGGVLRWLLDPPLAAAIAAMGNARRVGEPFGVLVSDFFGVPAVLGLVAVQGLITALRLVFWVLTVQDGEGLPPAESPTV